jgi:hypothetical protein
VWTPALSPYKGVFELRYQKPHDASGKEAIFISVENDDTTDTYVRGDLVHWKLADDTTTANFAEPNWNTRGLRVAHEVLDPSNATEVRYAGFVESLPAENATASNLNALRHAPRFFELQVYGFHDNGLIGSAAVIAGDLLECDATVAGALQEIAAPGNHATVAFAFETIADAARGEIFIHGIL